MLKPKVMRKQISHHKFNRVARSPDSKRVRVFLCLDYYDITTTIESYLYNGWVYCYHGKVTPAGYKTYHFRYEWNEAVYVAGRVV